MSTGKNHSVSQSEVWSGLWILMRGQIRDEKGVLLGKRVNIGSKMSEIILKTEKAEHTKQD